MYLHLWNTWIDNESSQIEEVDFGSNDMYIYIFPFFSFCECVCVWFCVWFCLYSFAFTICPMVLSVCIFLFFFVFSIVFSACYNWWICFLVWLLSSFFFYYFKKFLITIFYFNNILFYFIFFFLSFFFSLLFWVVWMTGSWCSSQASGLHLWGGRAKFRTLVHKRLPSST